MCYYKDINTNANYREVVTVHTEIEVRIDFDQKVISGTTKIRMKTCSDELRHIILDTSALVVKDVNVDGSPVFWELRPSEDQNGQPLLVQLTQGCCRDDTFELSVGSPAKFWISVFPETLTAHLHTRLPLRLQKSRLACSGSSPSRPMTGSIPLCVSGLNQLIPGNHS